MAVRGTEAKSLINNILKDKFQDDYLGEIGGKIYLKVPDGNEKIQVAISITCSKKEVPGVNIKSSEKDGGAFSLTSDGSEEKMVKKPIAPPPATVSAEETERIKQLIAELGL